jgi:PAS domain S-box-containing protein
MQMIREGLAPTRPAADADSEAALRAEIAELRHIVALQERAQSFGRTGCLISNSVTDRVYWSSSLFEQRKVPKRPYFTRQEALEFVHPEDREQYWRSRAEAVAARRKFEFEVRIVCGDGSIIWERCVSEPQYDAVTGENIGMVSVVLDVTERKRNLATMFEQEGTYRTLFNSIGDAIVVISDGLFVDCNQAALQMFNCTRADLIGHSPVEFSPERQADGHLSEESAHEKIAAALEGSRQVFDWRHKSHDGHEFDAEVTLTKAEATGGAFLFGVVRDVTEHRRAQTALREAHDKFAGAFRSSADAMLVAQLGQELGSGKILDANDAVQKVLGLSRSEIVGRRVGDVARFEGETSLEEIRRQVLSSRLVRGLPLKQTRPDGTVADLEMSGSVFELGAQTMSLIILRDVTEQHAAEVRISELSSSREASLRQLRAITDNLPVAISYQDANGAFRFVNRTLEQWFAAAPDELIGKRVSQVVGQDYLTSLKPVGRRRDAGELRSEATVAYPDGQARTVEITFVPDKREDGTLAGWYTLVIDLSERKAAEEQLLRSQRLQSIGKLTGGVAHDFNNLLGVISGNLELAHEKLRRRDDRDVAKLLEPAQRAAERGSTLTKSLLSFARQQPLSPQVTDISALVTDMVRLLRRTLPANIAVQLEGFSTATRCEIDPGQLQNALLNLVVNARDAMAKGGIIAIERQIVRIGSDDASGELQPGEYVILSVSDTGSGMPLEVVERAFEPFFTTKPTGEGTGLGLSMVYGFAKQSGGNVTLDSHLGKGTTVRIFLPKWSGKKEKEALVAHAKPSPRHGKVLVVEDDEDMRFIAVTMLKSMGYEVHEASDGRSAIATMEAQPDLVLLVTDVMLAGDMNGRNVADAAQTLRPGIKTLFMSGYSENVILNEGRGEAELHLIQKPFRKQDLALMVRRVLGD